MVKKLVGTIVFGLLLSIPAWATPTSAVIATPPQPQWNELTVEQKTILSPLGHDWDAMEYYRRKKWLGIAQHFPKMSPEEQQRTQDRMREWARLTPEQRTAAREKFRTLNQLSPGKKQEVKEKWEAYTNLPEEEKQKLKQQAMSSPVAKPGKAPVAKPAAVSASVPAPAATTTTPPVGPLPAAPGGAEPPPVAAKP